MGRKVVSGGYEDQINSNSINKSFFSAPFKSQQEHTIKGDNERKTCRRSIEWMDIVDGR